MVQYILTQKGKSQSHEIECKCHSVLLDTLKGHVALGAWWLEQGVLFVAFQTSRKNLVKSGR